MAALVDRNAHFAQGGRQVVLRLLYLHGAFNGDRSILGASVRRDVTAIFQDQVAAAAGLVTNPQTIQDATTVHEVGHLMGLVDLYLNTRRGDPNHPGHSRNPGSVMYWAVESDAIAQLLGAPIPTEFDDDDLADLNTIRNG